MRIFLWTLAVIGLVVGTVGAGGTLYFGSQMLITADRVHFPKSILVILIALRVIVCLAILGGSVWLTHWLVASVER
ncbi:hypothetical protein MKK63_19760 [Methylobacterium sp. J-088]|uniref:hypothetical protein n=1 Tax=Methylobacterium sp. J-088 TaxID=2836664 RepID=UPI001FBA7031|nr:hypothetical protein [Methylobacterium sp. J-088]MCJ2064927.1 hypothetical protein [Methylobacterium sp. J-088]